MRTIQGDSIFSPASPRAVIRIQPSMIYLGDLQYIVDQSRRAQQFIFIDVNSLGHVTHLLLVHFEGFLESKSGVYQLPYSSRVSLHNQEFMYDLSTVNIPAFIQQFPTSEVARAADYIRQRAYTLAVDVVAQRFVRQVDPEKRSLLTIVYMENSELTPVSLPDDQQDTAAAQPLIDRATERFSITFL